MYFPRGLRLDRLLIVVSLKQSELQRRIYQLKATVGCGIYSCFANAPGAGAALGCAAVPVPLEGAGFISAGLGDADLFGLNKRGNLNFRGVGDGTGIGIGVGEASVIAFL